MAREGVLLIVIQRQLGRGNLGITSIYLQGIDNAGPIETVHGRRADDPGQHVAAAVTKSKAGRRSSRIVIASRRPGHLARCSSLGEVLLVDSWSVVLGRGRRVGR
jgi:hypothetical protein